MNTAVTQISFHVSPDGNKLILIHDDVSQLAFEGNLTQLDNKRLDRVNAFYAKKLSPTELDYTGNDRDLLRLIPFLELLKCYLECISFVFLRTIKSSNIF